MTTTSGVLHIQSAPSPLCPHIEWAIGGVFGVPTTLEWRPQPAERGSRRSEYAWRGPVGTAARLASTLKAWPRLRFEVTEQATAATDGERYSYTPTLGVFHATIGSNGDILVPEDRLRHAISASRADDRDLRSALDGLLGAAWDAELDVFRQAGDGEVLRWLHRVG